MSVLDCIRHPYRRPFVGFRVLQGGRWDLQTEPGGEGGQRDLQIFLIPESSGRTAGWGWLSRAQGGPTSEAPRTAQAGYSHPGLFAASSGGATSSRRVGTDRQFCRLVRIIQVDQRTQTGSAANFIPTSGDISPSAGKCWYDRCLFQGQPLKELPDIQFIFHSSSSALGQLELWLFSEERFTVVSLGCLKKLDFFTVATQDLGEKETKHSLTFPSGRSGLQNFKKQKKVTVSQSMRY